jgi:hypothetical protein
MQLWTKRAGVVVAAVWVVVAGSDARAELFSKAYAFKADTILEIGTEMPGGLRLDSVEFVLPKAGENQGGTFGGPKVKIGISNLGTSSVKIGVAVAVTDADGRLVGVASGGTKLFPVRADRAIVYSLSITGVRSALAEGTVFRISVEPNP